MKMSLVLTVVRATVVSVLGMDTQLLSALIDSFGGPMVARCHLLRTSTT